MLRQSHCAISITRNADILDSRLIVVGRVDAACCSDYTAAAETFAFHASVTYRSACVDCGGLQATVPSFGA